MIIFIISHHFISSPSSNKASFSSLYAASKFINKTPTKRFIKKNEPINTNATKKYAFMGDSPGLGPYASVVISV